MRKSALIIFMGLLVLPAAPAPVAQYQSGWQGAKLPDPAVTPGEVDPAASTDEICHPGYSAKARNVPERVKHQVYGAYGARPKAGVCCEVDHLVSLELGGTNSTRNLWAQPYAPRPGAHEKDRLENWLHRAVCSGAITIGDAQRRIAEDWSAVYRDMIGGSR